MGLAMADGDGDAVLFFQRAALLCGADLRVCGGDAAKGSSGGCIRSPERC